MTAPLAHDCPRCNDPVRRNLRRGIWVLLAANVAAYSILNVRELLNSACGHAEHGSADSAAASPRISGAIEQGNARPGEAGQQADHSRSEVTDLSLGEAPHAGTLAEIASESTIGTTARAMYGRAAGFVVGRA